MELWLILTIVSVFAAGFNAFVYKIAAKEQMDIYVMMFFVSLISTCGALLLLLTFSDFSNPSLLVFLVAMGVSVTYFGTNITKVAALESIDSTLFFPIYKVLGPATVIFFGITLFGERFSLYEWIGLILSLLVPLMLITKSEHIRQMDLKRGLSFLVLTVIIGSVSHIFWKYGSDIAINTWLYVFYIELSTFLVSAVIALKRFHGSFVNKLAVAKDKKFLLTIVVSGLMNIVAGASIVFAFATGGALGIVNTVGSLYILIPIILSIIFYGEHWNARKVVAIILSIAALVFFI